MKIDGLITETLGAGFGASLVGHYWGVGGGVGLVFGWISHPIMDQASILLRSRNPRYIMDARGRIQESTLDMIRSVVLPIFLGQIVAWAALAIAGFPLSATSCLVLTAGSIAWNILTDTFADCSRSALGYGPDAPY